MVQQEYGPQQYNFNATVSPTPMLDQTDKPANKIRGIAIRQLDRGYVIEVGCQTFAVVNKTELIALFAEYVNDPLGTEKKYNEGKLFI